MLYPKIRIKKMEKQSKLKLKYFKEKTLSFLKIFKSYKSFILFVRQKFHF